MAETKQEEALNDAIDAWGERTSKDPDLISNPDWTFGWYAVRFLEDRGLHIVDFNMENYDE